MIAMLFAALVAVPLQAAPGPAPSPSPATADRPICRREVPTGSNFAKKVCHTRADWAAIDDANARNAGSALDNRRSNRPRED
jgi:hypothetical protein